MTKPVQVFLRGGLGNQLFQYAAGVNLSYKFDTPLVLRRDLLPTRVSSSGLVTTWPNQISEFEHLGTFLERMPSSDLRRWIESRFGQTLRWLGDAVPAAPYAFGQFAYENNPDYSHFAKIRKPLAINAYCADPAYFDNVADVVASSVRNIRNPSDWFHLTQSRIVEERPIGIHIRLGDYENLSHVYGSIRTAFLRRAVAQMKEIQPDCPIWIFSDDPARAKEILQGQVEFDHLVEPPETSRPLENLLLLSQCQGLICTNSTFSWWAAFLGHRFDNRVIFPRPLYPNNNFLEPKRWLLPAWQQVGDD
jgi:hypothetical protein